MGTRRASFELKQETMSESTTPFIHISFTTMDSVGLEIKPRLRRSLSNNQLGVSPGVPACSAVQTLLPVATLPATDSSPAVHCLGGEGGYFLNARLKLTALFGSQFRGLPT